MADMLIGAGLALPAMADAVLTYFRRRP